MKTISFVILLFVSAIFFSCEPAAYFVVKNESESQANVTIALNSKGDYDFLHSENDTIILYLNKNDSIIFACSGIWQDNEMERFANSIKSIEIKTSRIYKKYSEKDSIETLIKENRKPRRFLECDILIKIKDTAANSRLAQ